MLREHILLTAAQLQLEMDTDVAIFDCRFSLADTQAGLKAYKENHIPGAHYLHLDENLSGEKSKQTGRHPLPSNEQLQSLKQKLGVHSDSRIICYDEGKLAFASRAWLIFHLMGCHRVRMLEGGWQNWQSAITQPDSSTTRANFEEVKPNLQLLSLDDIMAHPENFQLIDAREKHRFTGESEPIDPVAGSIPGAINSVWLERLGENGRLIEKSFTPEGTKPVHYCGSGVTALVNLIAGLIASETPQYLYPGGWSEYINSRYFNGI